MLIYAWGGVIYLGVGVMLGAIYKKACEEDGVRFRKGAYALGVALWPVAVWLMLRDKNRRTR